MSTTYQNVTDRFTLTYHFKAPRELVFNAFGTAEALGEWWGPAETSNSVIALDFKPGGIFRFKMEYNGTSSYGKFVFGKIEPFELLEFTNSFADEKGEVIPAPFDIQLPLRIFYRLKFSETNGETTLFMTGEPVDGSPEQIAGFNSIADSMQEGFGGTFAKLEKYLAKK
jgi:uncharacterized protein YndB with AHSA1/START domain